MAVMELVIEGRYKEQQIINRFNYVASGSPAAVTNSFALVSAFGAIWDTGAVPPGYPPTAPFALLRTILHTAFTFVQISAFDVYSVTDFYQLPFLSNNAGTTGGEGASPALAYGYRTNVVRRDIRRGRKALRGVSETAVGEGGIISGALQPNLAAFAVRMSNTLSYDDEGNTITFAPVVVSKQKYDPDTGLPSPTGRAYRYYPTEAEQLQNVAQGVQWSLVPSIRTQRSSQYDNGR